MLIPLNSEKACGRGEMSNWNMFCNRMLTPNAAAMLAALVRPSQRNAWPSWCHTIERSSKAISTAILDLVKPPAIARSRRRGTHTQ